jgi:hypothetical protein
LLTLAAQFRANQSETLSHFNSCTREVVDGFAALAMKEEDAATATTAAAGAEGGQASMPAAGAAAEPAPVGITTREELELQFNRQLQCLRLLASSGPGNMKAAESLAASAASAIVSAAGEQAVQLVESHQTSLLMR